MIISETTGDILEDPSQSLVCPVNTIGIMSKGLAKQFKEKWPGLFYPYREACYVNHFKRHGVFVHDVAPDKKVVCLATKRHWRYNSRLEWIDWGLEILARDYQKYGITSLAIPAIGCGEGKLEWETVYNLIKHWLGDNCELPVRIYLP